MRQRAAESIYRLLTPAQTAHATAGGSQSSDAEVAPAEAGFQPAEQEMIRGVIELADQPVRSIMTTRADVFWLDVDDDHETNRYRLIDSGRTRALVCRGSLDNVIGLVETRTALPALLREQPVDLAALAQRPLIVLDSITALRLIDIMRESGERFAVVADPDGNIDGVVTATDVFAAIAGDLAEDEDQAEILRLDDGTLEASGGASLEELAAAAGREEIASAGRYTSLAGFLLFEFGRMPQQGEKIQRAGTEFEILATSTSRIERVLVRPREAEVAAPSLDRSLLKKGDQEWQTYSAPWSAPPSTARTATAVSKARSSARSPRARSAPSHRSWRPSPLVGQFNTGSAKRGRRSRVTIPWIGKPGVCGPAPPSVVMQSRTK